jgi:hypothetical protein
MRTITKKNYVNGIIIDSLILIMGVYYIDLLFFWMSYKQSWDNYFLTKKMFLSKEGIIY